MPPLNLALEAAFQHAKTEIKRMDHGRLILTLEIHNHSITLFRSNVEQDFKPQDLLRPGVSGEVLENKEEPPKPRHSVRSYNKGGSAVEITTRQHD